MRFNVWKVPYATTEQELRALFEPYGLVNRAKIVKDEDRRRAHGKVDMPNLTEGLAALKGLEGATLGGQRVFVQRDRTLERGAGMLALMKQDLEKMREDLLAKHTHLVAIQNHLMVTRKPHIGLKEAQRLGRYLNVPADFFLLEPKDVTKTRVDLELARVDAALGRMMPPKDRG